MPMYLRSNRRDIATWTLRNVPATAAVFEVALAGVVYPGIVTAATATTPTLVQLAVCGPLLTPVPVGDAVIVDPDGEGVLGEVLVDGISRTGDRIYLLDPA